jgi:hypothetical protein
MVVVPFPREFVAGASVSGGAAESKASRGDPISGSLRAKIRRPDLPTKRYKPVFMQVETRITDPW